MTHDVDFEPLTSDGGVRGGRAGAESLADLRRLAAVPVDLSVEIGRARMSVGETPSEPLKPKTPCWSQFFAMSP